MHIISLVLLFRQNQHPIGQMPGICQWKGLGLSQQGINITLRFTHQPFQFLQRIAASAFTRCPFETFSGFCAIGDMPGADTAGGALDGVRRISPRLVFSRIFSRVFAQSPAWLSLTRPTATPGSPSTRTSRGSRCASLPTKRRSCVSVRRSTSWVWGIWIAISR